MVRVTPIKDADAPEPADTTKKAGKRMDVLLHLLMAWKGRWLLPYDICPATRQAKATANVRARDRTFSR